MQPNRSGGYLFLAIVLLIVSPFWMGLGLWLLSVPGTISITIGGWFLSVTGALVGAIPGQFLVMIKHP